MFTFSTYRSYAWYVLATLLGIAVVVVTVSIITKERLEDARTAVELQIANQETVLTSVAEVTARGGADAVVSEIITDCSQSERSDFDTLLGALDRGLSVARLQELQRLFDRCGGFFAERKAVMVARLQREMEVFRSYIDLLETITETEVAERYQVSQWERLAAAERQQSQHFNELVTLQGDIIAALESGAAPGGDEIRTLLEEVSQVRERLAVATVQASELRSSLTAL